MSRNAVLSVGLILVSAVLAGCTSKEDSDPAAIDVSLTSDVPLSEDGRDLTTELLASDELPAPAWHLGHLFKNHIMFEGFDFQWDSVVVEERGNKWFLASTDPDAAQYEAMFDLFMMGEFEKDDLTTTSAGNPYYWYEFPLTDNKTWTRTVQYTDFVGAAVEHTMTYSAKYNPAIATPVGPRPGFDITAVTSEGNLYQLYDYVPALGWYAHFYQYNPSQPTANPSSDWAFHMMNMGVEMGYSGPYYVDTAKVVYEGFRYLAVDPEDPTQTHVPTESPHNAFTVSSDAKYLHGFLFSFAFAGIHEAILIDPNNQHKQYESQALGLAFDDGFWEYVGPAIPGEWKLELVGAGAASGGGGLIFEIVEEQRQFGGSGGGHEGH